LFGAGCEMCTSSFEIPTVHKLHRARALVCHRYTEGRMEVRYHAGFSPSTQAFGSKGGCEVPQTSSGRPARCPIIIIYALFQSTRTFGRGAGYFFHRMLLFRQPQ
jgi:hypothetical protein